MTYAAYRKYMKQAGLPRLSKDEWLAEQARASTDTAKHEAAEKANEVAGERAKRHATLDRGENTEVHRPTDRHGHEFAGAPRRKKGGGDVMSNSDRRGDTRLGPDGEILPEPDVDPADASFESKAERKRRLRAAKFDGPLVSPAEPITPEQKATASRKRTEVARRKLGVK
jgi:hypothetical protein